MQPDNWQSCTFYNFSLCCISMIAFMIDFHYITGKLDESKDLTPRQSVWACRQQTAQWTYALIF